MTYSEDDLQVGDTLLYVSRKNHIGAGETLTPFIIVEREMKVRTVQNNKTIQGIRLKLEHTPMGKEVVQNYIFIKTALGQLQSGMIRLIKGVPITYEIY